MIKRVFKWITNIILGILILIVVLSMISSFQGRNNPNHIPSVLGYKLMSVLTGSMRPALEPGDMIIAKEIDSKQIQVNDVITYWIGNNLVTHRVVEIVNKDQELFFKTKGDANNVEDQALVPSNRIVGKLSFNIPKGGYIASFIRSSKGFVLFFILPIMCILVGEFKKILSSMSQQDKNETHVDDMEV